MGTRHVQPVPDAAVAIRPAGRLSVTVTVPKLGPTVAAFETTMLYVPDWPAVKAPVCDLVIERLGDGNITDAVETTG